MVNLVKGQNIVLGDIDVTIGLGWTPNVNSTTDFDLDCSVFMLDGNKMIPTEKHFVYYNNTQSPDGAIVHSGDDTSGTSSLNGDDEQIKIDGTKIDPAITELVFVVTINDAISRNQNFGMVRDSYIRIVNNTDGSVIAKYELDEDFSIETAIEFGRLYKRNNEWKFSAAGIGYKEDLAFFVQKYYSGPVTK